jgi:hypothetical protein
VSREARHEDQGMLALVLPMWEFAWYVTLAKDSVLGLRSFEHGLSWSWPRRRLGSWAAWFAIMGVVAVEYLHGYMHLVAGRLDVTSLEACQKLAPVLIEECVLGPLVTLDVCGSSWKWSVLPSATSVGRPFIGATVVSQQVMAWFHSGEA